MFRVEKIYGSILNSLLLSDVFTSSEVCVCEIWSFHVILLYFSLLCKDSFFFNLSLVWRVLIIAYHSIFYDNSFKDLVKYLWHLCLLGVDFCWLSYHLDFMFPWFLLCQYFFIWILDIFKIMFWDNSSYLNFLL